MINRHGHDAPIHAAMRADEMLEADDREGRAVWLKVWKTITGLLSAQPLPGAKVH